MGLLAHVHELIDAEGLPAYLESTDPPTTAGRKDVTATVTPQVTGAVVPKAEPLAAGAAQRIAYRASTGTSPHSRTAPWTTPPPAPASPPCAPRSTSSRPATTRSPTPSA